MDLKKIPIERIAAYVVVAAGLALFLRFLALPLFFAALPFLLAFSAAYACRPLAVRLHRLTKIPVGGLCVFLVFFFVFVLSLVLFFAVRVAAKELLSLGNRLVGEGNATETVAHLLSDWWMAMTARFPFLAGFAPEGDAAWEGLLLSRLGEIGMRIGEYALSAAGRIAQALPLWLLFLAVSMIAAFYFARDMNKMRKETLSFFPRRVGAMIIRVKDGAWHAAVGYLRAYFCLMLLTFLLLSVGFLLLSVPYAILLAALLAVIDFLPVLGVGLFLVPWGIFDLLLGNAFRGVGLLILFAAVSLAKQVAEPRMVGRQLGLHPLLALAAMYLGFRFFGFAGLILAPPCCFLLRAVLLSSDAAQPGKGQG